MNGKEYVKQAIDQVETVVSGIKEANILNGDPLMEGAQNACDALSGLKNKATLRTKDGSNLAFPIFDAARNLEEAWEDAQVNDDAEDLKWRLEGFIDTALALSGALKDRTVIMT